jgi:signal transduction histidine kinase
MTSGFVGKTDSLVTDAVASQRSVCSGMRIDIKDQCGGLPKGFEVTMFTPFTQGSADRSGVGLGLSIARHIVESHKGILSECDAPSSGCVFTIDLPRHAIPSSVAMSGDVFP